MAATTKKTRGKGSPIEQARRIARQVAARTLVELGRGDAVSLRPPDLLTVTQLAAQVVRLPLGNAEPGLLRPERTPHTITPQDCCGDAETRRVVLMLPAQSGKTQAMLNKLAHSMLQDPGRALFAAPRREDSEGFLRHRLKPMIDASPRLAKLKTGRATDWQRNSITLRNGMTVHTGWAGSAISLASHACRDLYADELDKWVDHAGNEGHPLKLAIARTRTYVHDHKIILASTPVYESGRINREYLASTQHVFAALCPKCSKYHVPTFERVRFDDSLEPAEILKDPHAAVYVCPHCGFEMDDGMRMRAMAGGTWTRKPKAAPEGWENDLQVEDIEPESSTAKGFHVEGVASPWILNSAIAAQFLAAKDDPAELQEFVNQWQGKPWKIRTRTRQVDRITQLRDEKLERGIVERGAVFLTAGCDVHKERGLYYTIRAWGFGATSWLVDCGIVYNLEALENAVFRRTFPVRDRPEQRLAVKQAFIDANYQSHKAYGLARQWPGRALPVKGHGFERSFGVPLRKVRVDEYLWQATLDVTYYKNTLDGLLAQDPGAPGRFHLFRDTPVEYCQHMCAEVRVMKPGRLGLQEIWVRRENGGRNDWLDCEVYALAAAEAEGVNELTPDAAADDPIEREMAEDREHWIPKPEGSWLPERGGRWL